MSPGLVPWGEKRIYFLPFKASRGHLYAHSPFHTSLQPFAPVFTSATHNDSLLLSSKDPCDYRGPIQVAKIMSSLLNHISKTLHQFIVIWCCCSVAQLWPTLCNPVDCSTPGFPVPHYLLEFVQTLDAQKRKKWCALNSTLSNIKIYICSKLYLFISTTI